MNHTQKATAKRQAEAQRLQELKERVRMKGAVIVPKAPKEELEEIVKQANNNAAKTAKGGFKRFTLIL